MTITTNESRVARWRDRTSSVLLILAAIGAALSFAGAVSAVSDAGSATRFVELWRMLGFFVFTGLFLLLAWRPRVYAGVWELAIVDKAGLAIAGLALGGSYAGASAAAAADGALAVTLVIAYLLSKGYLAWGFARSGIAPTGVKLGSAETRSTSLAGLAAGLAPDERAAAEHPAALVDPERERSDRAA